MTTWQAVLIAVLLVVATTVFAGLAYAACRDFVREVIEITTEGWIPLIRRCVASIAQFRFRLRFLFALTLVVAMMSAIVHYLSIDGLTAILICLPVWLYILDRSLR